MKYELITENSYILCFRLLLLAYVIPLSFGSQRLGEGQRLEQVIIETTVITRFLIVATIEHGL